VGILEIVVVILLVLLNGFFAMSELAIVSSRQGRLERLAADGSAGASAALSLAKDPGRFLAATQFGMTLTGILAGAFSGATLADRIEEWVGFNTAITAYAKPISIGVIVVAVTYFTLVIGELVPKQVALKNPEAIAVRVAPAIAVFARAAVPVLWLLNLSSNFVLCFLRQGPGFERRVTDEDILSLVREGEKSGLLHSDERKLVEGVLDLADSSVRTIMTPRPDVAWIDLDAPRDMVLKNIRACPYAQVLACRGSLDATVGVVRKQDLLDQSLDGVPVDVEGALHTPLYIPEGVSILKALDLFRKTPVNTAVIVDEYGTIQGIVTRTDLLEAVAGDLPDVEVELDPKVTRRHDGALIIEGSMLIADVMELLGLRDRPQGDFVTLAGFALHQLHHIPAPTEQFTWRDWRFRVVDMDGSRIDKMLVSPLEGPGQDISQHG
jgi:putative hemolysin